jgi:hypothetical protein
MDCVAVFVKRAGILVPCRAYAEPDGALWRCACCEGALIRASYGILNGLWRCPCGCEVELLVNGLAIDLEAMNGRAFADHDNAHDHASDSARYATGYTTSQAPGWNDIERRAAAVTDEDFLRGLKITPSLAIEEEPC